MSSISSTAAQGESLGARILQAVVDAVKRWVIAQAQRRLEQAAITQLRAFSDRQLGDIGIARAEIEVAVMRGRATSAGVPSITKG